MRRRRGIAMDVNVTGIMYDAPVSKTTKEGKEYLVIKASTKNSKAKDDENTNTTFFINVFSEAQIELFKKCGRGTTISVKGYMAQVKDGGKFRFYPGTPTIYTRLDIEDHPFEERSGKGKPKKAMKEEKIDLDKIDLDNTDFDKIDLDDIDLPTDW